jgi:hypothetical protein
LEEPVSEVSFSNVRVLSMVLFPAGKV